MKKNHYATMKRIILFSIILVPSVLFVLILIIGYYFFETSIESSTISTMKRVVEDHIHMISQHKANLEFILNSYNYGWTTKNNSERQPKSF